MLCSNILAFQHMIRASHQYKVKIYGVSWLILRSGSITSRYESFTDIIIIFVDKWSQAHQIYLYRKLANAKETVIANMFATALIARWRYSGRDRLTKVGSADTIMNDKTSKTFAPQKQEKCCEDSSCCGSRTPYLREIPKVGRNDPCPCDSGRKFKKCCGCA